MNCMPGRFAILISLSMHLALLPLRGAAQEASPYRGLWVGSASLRAVTEVTVPLDASNVAVAPDPRVPTPTSDAADIRILVHVNGAGQAVLLKDVAILNRAYATTGSVTEVAARESDLALVTDPRTYVEYPPQPASRIGSAAFDFGDAKATEAVDALVAAAAGLAASFATNADLRVASQAERVQARNDAVASMLPELETIVSRAAVATSFAGFLTVLDAAALDTLAADPSAPLAAALGQQAASLRDQSFYRDSRALDMLHAVVSAVVSAPVTNRPSVAHNTAACFADVDNQYHRLIAGKGFGDLIVSGADAAATAAKLPGATRASLMAAMLATPEAAAVITAALQTKVPFYNDTRSSDAVDSVLDAMAGAALANAALAVAEIRLHCEQSGRDALANMVARYPVHALTPTLDYNAFVASSLFREADSTAAAAAAAAAIDRRATDALYTYASVHAAAKAAAATALNGAFAAAARARRTELPLSGTFAPGSGDPAAIAALAHPDDLGPAGLEGCIYLPAGHPTNPFRHRRHPDHTAGFDIRRIIRFDFDAATGGALEPARYGVDRITGTYREEIFGLHKPLGAEPDVHPVGLRTEGRFELNRISLIDALNAR